MFEVINRNGRRFGVRVVPVGGTYGRGAVNDRVSPLTGKPFGPMVVFHDLTHVGGDFGPHGQQAGSYYLSTLRERPADRGLALDCGVPEWSIDSAAMLMVHRYLDGECPR